MAPPELPPAPPKSFWRGALTTLLVLGLLAIIGALVSEQNHRRYRLSERGGVVVVERGRFLPYGFEPYVPADERLRRAYAPLPLPAGERFGQPEMFDERVDLDRALFGTLSGWSRRLLEQKEVEAAEQAADYVSRCELLPGLAEEQRLELRSLRSDIAFASGTRLVSDALARLEKAVRAFELAIELGSSQAAEARRWVDVLRGRLAEYGAPRADESPTPSVPPSAAGPLPRVDNEGAAPVGAGPKGRL